jgi:hypothetical protein
MRGAVIPLRCTSALRFTSLSARVNFTFAGFWTIYRFFSAFKVLSGVYLPHTLVTVILTAS